MPWCFLFLLLLVKTPSVTGRWATTTISTTSSTTTTTGGTDVELRVWGDSQVTINEIYAFDPSGVRISGALASISSHKVDKEAANVLDLDESTKCEAAVIPSWLLLKYPPGTVIASLRIINTGTIKEHRILNQTIAIEVDNTPIWQHSFTVAQKTYNFNVSATSFSVTSTTTSVSSTFSSTTTATASSSSTTATTSSSSSTATRTVSSSSATTTSLTATRAVVSLSTTSTTSATSLAATTTASTSTTGTISLSSSMATTSVSSSSTTTSATSTVTGVTSSPSTTTATSSSTSPFLTTTAATATTTTVTTTNSATVSMTWLWTTSTVASTTTAPATASTQTPDGLRQAANAVDLVLQDKVDGFIQDLGNQSIIELQTSQGKLLLVDLDSALDEGLPMTFIANSRAKVTIPREALQELPRGSVFTILPIIQNTSGPGDKDPFSEAAGGTLVANVLDISVYNANGGKVTVNLDRPLLFRLPGSPAHDSSREVKCAFLDLEDATPVWSGRGVWLATAEELAALGEDPMQGTWCWTSHLSIFSLIAQAVLGCSNAELLTEEAIAAVTEREDWYSASSALLTFCVWGILVLAVICGNLYECYAFRLGSTLDVKTRVVCCRNLVTCGPQLIKHRYAAFVVYLKDVFQCVAARTKLKHSSLTQCVQRCLAVRSGVSLACVAQHCWSGGGWIDTEVSIAKTTLMHKLDFHGGGAEKAIQNDLFGEDGFLQMVWRFLMMSLAVHPLLDSMRVGAGSLTVGKRTCLQVSGIVGVIATNALIFNFAGESRGWEAPAECFIEPRSHLFIAVATLVSVTANSVPNTYLTELAKQVYRRPLWALVFWFLLVAYMGIGVLVVVIALANLNSQDQAKWYDSLEWSLCIKLIAMPLAQGLRHTVLLEIFLREDRSCPPSQQFRVLMGLSHPSEIKLSTKAQEAIEVMARRSISVEELVNFAALLGDKVMMDFDPATSTSDDVMRAAIQPLSLSPPSLENYPVKVVVEQVSGLQFADAGPENLTCCVLHLGKQAKKQRPCLKEEQSSPCPVMDEGNSRCCNWTFEASITRLEPGDAIGFAVHDSNGALGMALLPAEDVLFLNGAEWAGQLPLYPPDNGLVRIEKEVSPTCSGRDSFTMPSQAASVPATAITGSRSEAPKKRSSGVSQPTRLDVKVRLPKGYVHALSLHERHKMKLQPPPHQSEVIEPTHELEENLVMQPALTEDVQFDEALSVKPFCEVKTFSKSEGRPPDKMVVHSRQGRFYHLVATVLADALGGDTPLIDINEKLQERDFHGLLDMLHEGECHDTRYWIDMFAIDERGITQSTDNKGLQDWHEGLLTCMPTLLRAMRRASCKKTVDNIRHKKETGGGPLMQLLILDRGFHFLHENSCLAEMMVAQAMRVRQRLVLHPDHLVKGGGLGAELTRLATDLDDASRATNLPWTAPYLEDKQAVYDTVRDLAVAGVKEHMEDHESTWQELSMTNILATAGAVDGEGRPNRQAESSATDDLGAMEGDADAGD